MKYRRYIPIITPILIFLLCKIFLQEPTFFYASLSLGVMFIVLAIKYISLPNKINWLLFIILPLLFFLSLSLYSSVIIGHLWINLVFLLILIFIFLFLRALYYYSNYDDPKWLNQLENLSIAGSFLTVFSASATIFVLPAFLNLPSWLMMFILAILFALLLLYFKSFKAGDAWLNGVTIGINVLVLTELAWIFSLLPLNFNILGLFLALVYYLDLTIIRLDRRGGLNFRSIKLPILAGLILFACLLLTARWL